jgi:hypothetical protein
MILTMEESVLSKQEELRLFLEAGEDLINGKYILADIKIVSLLKTIAQSEALLALFKNSLVDFDYEEAKKKYLVKNKFFSGDKGEFVLPESSREILAFVFNVLMDIDGKRIELGEFLNKYFYEDGSFSSGFATFSSSMIRPFCNTVKALMTSVIEGKLQDPIEALAEEEERQRQQKIQEEAQQKLDKELSEKAYGESLKKIKEILLNNKLKIKNAKISVGEKEQMILVVDMFANALDSQDKDSVIYAFVAYRYMAKAHPFALFRASTKVSKLLQDVINGL